MIYARIETRTVLEFAINSDQSYGDILSIFGQELFYWRSNIKKRVFWNVIRKPFKNLPSFKINFILAEIVFDFYSFKI